MRETPKAQQAWADYLAMGPGRSLEKLLLVYEDRVQTEGKPSVAVPTTRLATLQSWSTAFNWQDRLSALAEQAVREASDAEAAYRRSIMEAGFGLAHERVRALKTLAESLLAELTADGDANRRWIKEPKGIGGGDNFKEIEVERFNSQEVEQLRGLLDDIAKETGGRVTKAETTLKGDSRSPIRIINPIPPPPPDEQAPDGD